MTDPAVPLPQAARSGNDPAVICRLSSGWVFLNNLQFLPGYCILQADPSAGSLNELNWMQRAAFLCDMALVGDALLDVTGAYRINYAILGNSDPRLHAHIVPRFMSEPEGLRQGPPWSYASEVIAGRPFDLERDRELIRQIAVAIEKRL